MTSQRVRRYYEIHDRLPSEGDELPVLVGRNATGTDGWGREIGIRTRPGVETVVFSLGKDGEVGGVGEDADMSEVVSLADPYW